MRDPNVRRLKRGLHMTSRNALNAIFGKELIHRHVHLQRIKRDLSTNPCFKLGSLTTFTLLNNNVTYKVECEVSTNTGCFHVAGLFSTAMCAEMITFFTSTGESVVQDCSCAS